MAELVRLPDVALAVLRRSGSAGLPRIGRWASIDGDRVVAIGPDEWLAVAPDADAAALLGRLAAIGDAVDVSGSRVGYRADGDGALDLLLAGCALDLEALRPGDAAATLLARVQVVVCVDDAGFLVMPRRSFRTYVEAWAAVAAGSIARA